MHTPLLAPAAPSIAAGIRTPAAARALLAVLLAPLFALMDQAVARIFVRLEDLLAQFQAGTLPVPAAQSPARDTSPHSARIAPEAAPTPSWLADLITLAARDTAPTRRHRAPQPLRPQPAKAPQPPTIGAPAWRAATGASRTARIADPSHSATQPHGIRARDSPAVKTGAREARSGAAILLRYQNK